MIPKENKCVDCVYFDWDEFYDDYVNDYFVECYCMRGHYEKIHWNNTPCEDFKEV